ncbi:TonB-dependent receptor [Pseudoalteromonas sp. MIP2626]|uniref:TonB-dependent receptor plug domain-containing protein n=1 Tax=Pseudoalteromonas sp. MIP2626 TaxID=2705464 RepID=UPI0015CAC102|nr:TonB-dependent receptor [Pseudoalteromonas sp. MIP2626]NYR12322.1 TonB-dependent receptor [Pseudoalteromonas sp. MIP2626]
MLNNKVSKAVRLAIAFGAASTAAFSASSFAAEEGAEKVERIEVTGSRIKRTDIEGANPVVVIDRASLDNSGQLSVADVLNRSTFNSFGSIQPSSGNTAQSQATVNLRGLGSSRTLVLINGRKMPGSPVMGGGAADLNTIPFAAVERIEVMGDGASAVYGSDAIAGVVNIILRKDFEGVQIQGRMGKPSRDGGGDEGSFSMITGIKSEKSNLVFSYEHDERDIIYQRDRWFSRSSDDGSGTYGGTTGQSWYGRNILDMSTFEFNPMITTGDCSAYGDAFAYHNDAPNSPDDDGCHYDYTALAADAASTKRDSVFVNFDYDINDDLIFNFRSLNSRNESFGRFAPAAGWFAFPIDMPEDTAKGLTAVNAGDRGYYRFDSIGARDTWQVSNMADWSASLNGMHESFDWHVDAHYNRYDMNEWGQGYVHRPSVENAIIDGWDPRDPDQSAYSEQLASFAANSNRRSGSTLREITAGVSFNDLATLDGGDLGLYIGASYRETDYFDQAEAQNEAKNIIGTAGGSAAGDRIESAVFAELLVPVTDMVELNFAARYDDYSDVGSSFVPKASIKFQPLDELVLRASWGKGFRAPTLEDLYKAPSESAAYAKDVVLCGAAGTSRGDCKEEQHTTYYVGTTTLQPEESESINLGIVYNVTDNIDVSLDYYDIEITNQISSLSAQDVFDLENAGLLGNPEDPSDNAAGYDQVSVDRGGSSTGRSLLVTAPMANIPGFSTDGLDFKLNARFDLGEIGQLRSNFAWSEVLSYKSPDIIGYSNVNQVGRDGLPERRISLGLTWDIESHLVNVNFNHIASTAEKTEADESGTIFTAVGNLSSYNIVDVNYTYITPWNVELTAGINNLADKDPILKPDLSYDSSLYSQLGRLYYAGFKLKF